MALYSSIMFKGRTGRDSLKGGYEKFIEKRTEENVPLNINMAAVGKKAPPFSLNHFSIYSEKGMQINLTSMKNTIFINNYDTIVVRFHCYLHRK